ncbi:MAG: ATP-binding cassette domain-containing protein [Candidatus Njordarchaeales archaeon]
MINDIIVAEKLRKIYRIKVSKGLFRKSLKEIHALKGVDLRVKEGEIFGLLGPNGAGKTTLIKILTTLLLPDDGRALVNGYDVVKESRKVRASIGVMLMGERSLYWKLTGRENLEYFGSLYSLSGEALKKRVNEVIEFVGIKDFADRLVETYSSGQKMLLAFAKALINDAPLLFLDEPTVAMDPRNAALIREKIKLLRDEFGKTIFLTTHLMHEAEMLCDRVAIIDVGQILAVGSPQELKATLRGKSSIEIDVKLDRIDEVIPAIRAIDDVIDVASSYVKVNGIDAVRIRVLCNSPRTLLPDIIELLVKKSIDVLYVNPQEPTLEDVFMYYTGRLLTEDTRQGV